MTYDQQVRDQAALFVECESWLGKQDTRESAAKFADVYARDWAGKDERKAAFYRAVAQCIRHGAPNAS